MEEKLLAPLRDVPLPPSAVDLHRAVRDGRRQVRRRRIAATATAGLAVVAVLAAAPALVGRPDRPTPVAPALTPSPTAAPMPATAPAAFDPARQYAEFGWVPPVMNDRTVRTGTDQFALTASAPQMPPRPAEETPTAELRMVPAGRDIALGIDRDFAVAAGRAGSAGLEPAELVNGRTARWNTNATVEPRSAALRWEYAPGAWAEVIVRYAPVSAGDPRAVARRIALDIRYAVDWPIRLPVRFATPPAGLKPMAYLVTRRAYDGWDVEVSYGTGKRTKYGDWSLVVRVLPFTYPQGEVIALPDSRIDGHPARRRSSVDGGASLQVYWVQGLYVEMTAHDKATLRTLGGNLDGLFRSATLYPEIDEWR
ncbi:hypothetical protein GA0074696_0319 [Micromonospora purpureochromogenes]|uniref:Uncharacterized protein n=1 Tax=Micromonospora purpureochromogenes TaxID=47872 RepID=A0A1C4UEY9_9ACTN|nr:hypothetical protein [Micromonospora purpureochromogenes]SCE70222.1 hypothetical protein GA0074696_0319 [Micromonospora purpureochromogenes]